MRATDARTFSGDKAVEAGLRAAAGEAHSAGLNLNLREIEYRRLNHDRDNKAKLYEIGTPDENSPVLYTTNFSLTYFSVEGEVERSKVPTYIRE